MLGDTPASIVFGCDPHVPGLQHYEEFLPKEARLTAPASFSGIACLREQLKDIEELRILDKSPIPKDFVIGDSITYKLSIAERKHHKHVSGENKYKATRSFPQRITAISKNNLTVRPIWTSAKERTVPKPQAKLISSYVSKAL